MALAQKILAGIGLGARAPPAGWVFDKRITVQATVSIPANTPANASNNITFVIDPKVGGVTQFTIPKSFRYVLVDAYIKASDDVGADGIAKLKRNFYEDHVITPPLSTMLVSNPSRPMIAGKAWEEGDSLSGEFINTVAVGAEAKTNTFYLVFDIYKKV
jgi:hypothetical protein